MNWDTQVHDFSSDSFFKAIATGELAGPGGRTAAPRLRSIGLNGGETKDLTFVLVVAGTYPFDCREFLHDTFGMTGTAVIE